MEAEGIFLSVRGSAFVGGRRMAVRPLRLVGMKSINLLICLSIIKVYQFRPDSLREVVLSMELIQLIKSEQILGELVSPLFLLWPNYETFARLFFKIRISKILAGNQLNLTNGRSPAPTQLDQYRFFNPCGGLDSLCLLHHNGVP